MTGRVRAAGRFVLMLGIGAGGLSASAMEFVPLERSSCAVALVWSRPEDAGVTFEQAAVALEALAERIGKAAALPARRLRVDAGRVVASRIVQGPCDAAALAEAVRNLPAGPPPGPDEIAGAIDRLHAEVAARREDPAARMLDVVRLAVREFEPSISAPLDAERLARIEPAAARAAAGRWLEAGSAARLVVMAPREARGLLGVAGAAPVRPEVAMPGSGTDASAAAGRLVIGAGRAAGRAREQAMPAGLTLAFPVRAVPDARQAAALSVLVEIAARGEGSFIQQLAVELAGEPGMQGSVHWLPGEGGGGLLVFQLVADRPLDRHGVLLVQQAIGRLREREPSRAMLAAAVRRLRAAVRGADGLDRAIDAATFGLPELPAVGRRRTAARFAREIAAFAREVLADERSVVAVSGPLDPAVTGLLGGVPVAVLRWAVSGPEWNGPEAEADDPVSGPAAVRRARRLFATLAPGWAPDRLARGYEARYRLSAPTPIGVGELMVDLVRDGTAATATFRNGSGGAIGAAGVGESGALALEPAWLLAAALAGRLSIREEPSGPDEAPALVFAEEGGALRVRLIGGSPGAPVRRIEVLEGGGRRGVETLEPLSWTTGAGATLVGSARIRDGLGFSRTVELLSWSPLGAFLPAAVP